MNRLLKNKNLNSFLVWRKLLIIVIFFLSVPLLTSAQTGLFVVPGQCAESGICSSCDIAQIVVNVVNAVFGLVGALAILFVLIAGIQYMTSMNNQDRLGKAKEAFAYALIGLVVAMTAFVIVNFVVRLIAGDTNAFGNPWSDITCGGGNDGNPPDE